MNTIFFEQFLVITEVRSILFVLVLFALFGVLAYVKKKEWLNMSGRLMLATVLGLVLGIAMLAVAGMPDAPLSVSWIAEVRTWYGLIADGFMSLLRMIVVPLVLVSIIRVIVNMDGSKSVGKLVSRGVGFLVFTTLIGAAIGLTVASIFGLGSGTPLNYGDDEVRAITNVVATVLGFLPDNPFAALSNGAVIPTMVFASFVGLAIRTQSKIDVKMVQPFIDFNEAVYTIIMNIATKIISWLPYAIIALLANTIASRGLQAFTEVAQFAAAYVISVVIMFGVQLLLLALSGLNPLMYLKNVGKALILAFTSRTSLGTLPVSVKVLTENAGLNQGTATFITSLGANGGMNGGGIYASLISVMIANMIGVPIDFTFIVLLFMVIGLSSFGIAGVPGGILLMISIPLTALGLGEHFALAATVFAIDPIIDMFRTFTNVSGALTASLVVGKSIDEVEMATYNDDAINLANMKKA